MAEPRALIVTGDGLNCEEETAFAFRLAGAEPCLVHITDLLDGEKKLKSYQILAFIGGFSNGDHLGAGRIQAGRFKHRLQDDLQNFINDHKPIIGICNGFQTLVKMGVLPGVGEGRFIQNCTIMGNDSGKFEDRWVYLRLNGDSPCIWTRDMATIFLPVRHGEGKFFTDDPGIIPALFTSGQVVAQYSDDSYSFPVMDYPLNPNGSLHGIAAICDRSGLIFGLMPHPEAFLYPYNHPSWTRMISLGDILPERGEGAAIFLNGVRYLK